MQFWQVVFTLFGLGAIFGSLISLVLLIAWVADGLDKG